MQAVWCVVRRTRAVWCVVRLTRAVWCVVRLTRAVWCVVRLTRAVCHDLCFRILRLSRLVAVHRLHSMNAGQSAVKRSKRASSVSISWNIVSFRNIYIELLVPRQCKKIETLSWQKLKRLNVNLYLRFLSCYTVTLYFIWQLASLFTATVSRTAGIAMLPSRCFKLAGSQNSVRHISIYCS
jgi:hypothetical protein